MSLVFFSLKKTHIARSDADQDDVDGEIDGETILGFIRRECEAVLLAGPQGPHHHTQRAPPQQLSLPSAPNGNTSRKEVYGLWATKWPELLLPKFRNASRTQSSK